jgi:hypothetical protein
VHGVGRLGGQQGAVRLAGQRADHGDHDLYADVQ